jgi:hypothetical protein
MTYKGKFGHSLKRLLRDKRFALSATCIFVWWLVLPSAPGCYLSYLGTPWGQVSVLFLATLLLWIKPPVLHLASIVLSTYAFLLASVSLGYDWEEIAFSPSLPFLGWGEREGWGEVLVQFMWREVLVCALAVHLAIYAGFNFVRWGRRG